uniref:Uncharacterized protein n=1 Tax=Anguilla anguilla TaxID=7936 RepID=A0A0E9RWI9_ANGAN
MHSEILKNTVWKKQHIIQQFCTKDPCNSQRKKYYICTFPGVFCIAMFLNRAYLENLECET